MRRFKRTLIAAAFALALSPGIAAAQFSSVYFFGDSLTDDGSFKPLLPPGTGLFTTNPGPMWVQIFGSRYGFAVSPANQGGNDYAEGGARVTELPGVPNAPPTATATPVAQQIQQLLAKGPLDPHGLYSVWAGANDLFEQLGLLAAGAVTPAQAQANLVLAATQLVQQVGILHAAGANYIVVFNLPDVGKTPFGLGSGEGPTISALSGLFNSTLNTGLNSLGVDTIRLNTFGLLNEIIASPGTYGLTNVTSPACTSTVGGQVTSLFCTPSTLVSPTAPQTYLFADTVHPTSIGEQFIADYLSSVVTAPAQMGMLAEAPLQVEQANFRALDGRMIANIGAPKAMGKFETYAVYDYGNYNQSDSFGGGDAYTNTVLVGGDIKISDTLLAGLAFGYTEDKISFGNNSGGFKLNEPTITAYVGWGSGPWYVGGTLGAGDVDLRSIQRTFSIGPASRTESGSTGGTHLIARALGGYWFDYGTWLTGPFARLTYQQVKVDQWSETGTSSTAMVFGAQKRDSFFTSLGWQASGVWGSVRPFGRVTWEKDWNNDDRTVRAGLVSLSGDPTFGLPALKADNSYALFDIGASTDLGSKLVGFITINATAGKSDGNYQAVTVGIRVPL